MSVGWAGYNCTMWDPCPPLFHTSHPSHRLYPLTFDLDKITISIYIWKINAGDGLDIYSWSKCHIVASWRGNARVARSAFLREYDFDQVSSLPSSAEDGVIHMTVQQEFNKHGSSGNSVRNSPVKWKSEFKKRKSEVDIKTKVKKVRKYV